MGAFLVAKEQFQNSRVGISIRQHNRQNRIMGIKATDFPCVLATGQNSIIHELKGSVLNTPGESMFEEGDEELDIDIQKLDIYSLGPPENLVTDHSLARTSREIDLQVQPLEREKGLVSQSNRRGYRTYCQAC
jgi:hypothetical protein